MVFGLAKSQNITRSNETYPLNARGEVGISKQTADLHTSLSANYLALWPKLGLVSVANNFFTD